MIRDPEPDKQQSSDTRETKGGRTTKPDTDGPTAAGEKGRPPSESALAEDQPVRHPGDFAASSRSTDQGRPNDFAKKSFFFKIRPLLLFALWTGSILGLYSLEPGNVFLCLMLWLVGLGVAALHLREIKILIGNYDLALQSLHDRADRMERRVEKRSASLHLRQRQLQALMDQVDCGVFLKNNHHEFILVNSRLTEQVKVPAELLLGSTGFDFLEPAPGQKIRELEQRVIFEKRALELADLFDQATRPEVRLVNLHIFPVIGPDGKVEGTGGLLRDVTGLQFRERELTAARAEAQKAAQVKSSFLANISHEFRSPLNGIIGTADLLARSDLTAEQAAMAAVIKNAGDTLLGTLNDVLDLSRTASGTMRLNKRPFSLRQLVFEVLKGLAPIARNKHLSLIADIAPLMPDEFFGDDIRLRQILLNLVSNALKFTGAGEVRITVSPVDMFDFVSQGPEPAPGREAGGDAVCRLRLSVSDTGIGIPEDKRKIIFEAFEQADTSNTRNYGGAGLGLAICHRLAALMDSKLNLASTEGRGSTFWLDLDLPVISEPLMGPSAAAMNLPDSFDHSVLCLDEREADRRALIQPLEEWGLSVREASGADEGLEKLKLAAAAGRPFELVLADSRLKLSDGRDFSTALAGEPGLAEAPLVELGPADPATEARPSGGAPVFRLPRPIRPQALLRAVAVALGVWEHFDSGRLAAGPTAEESLVSSRRLKILLTEDMEVNQFVARNMLEELGHQVTVAANGAEALGLVRDQTFDLIFMDIQMPVMDGLTTVARIRELEFEQKRPHTPVAAMTAHALTGDREKYLAQGLDDYISKPLLMSELARLIEDMIKRWNIEGEPGAVPPETPDLKEPEGPEPSAPGCQPLIDLEVTRLSFGGNQQLLRKSMELYLRDAPTIVDRIQAALEGGQPEEAGAQAHALKGISGYYTKAGPYLLALELDRVSRRADWPDDRPRLRQLAADLAAGVESLMAEMRGYLSSEE